jgi:cyclase
MQEERVARDIHIFTSELYAQVTAGLVVTEEGCILIDTLPFPEETQHIVTTAEAVCPLGVRLLVYTHYHADHIYGGSKFPRATIVSHALTRRLIVEKGYDALAEAQSQTPELSDIKLVLPSVVFDSGEMNLHLGEKTVQLFHSPGHTPDSIAVFVEEDKVLFAADTLLPVPTIFDGDLETLITSLKRLKEWPIDSIVQGHGEVILRGEVTERIDLAITYLRKIQKLVRDAIAKGKPRESLLNSNIEACGLSRIPLNGLVQQLHVANLLALYDRMK